MTTPRVNSAHLSDFGGRTVRLIGKVLELSSESATLESADGGQVTVKLAIGTTLSGTYVEVVAKVVKDNLLQEYTSVDLGDNIDMGLVQKVTDLSQAHPDLFPQDA